MKRFFSYKLATFRGMIQENKHNLFFYLLFLRATPLMPNWYHLFSSLLTKCLAQGFLLMSLFSQCLVRFVNLASPHLGVPIAHFFFATMLGSATGSV